MIQPNLVLKMGEGKAKQPVIVCTLSSMVCTLNSMTMLYDFTDFVNSSSCLCHLRLFKFVFLHYGLHFQLYGLRSQLYGLRSQLSSCQVRQAVCYTNL